MHTLDCNVISLYSCVFLWEKSSQQLPLKFFLNIFHSFQKKKINLLKFKRKILILEDYTSWKKLKYNLRFFEHFNWSSHFWYSAMEILIFMVGSVWFQNIVRASMQTKSRPLQVRKHGRKASACSNLRSILPFLRQFLPFFVFLKIKTHDYDGFHILVSNQMLCAFAFPTEDFYEELMAGLLSIL